ncbi:hypothetical protein C8F01DRAFT_1262145 [Mycena amicta]|nr:hypothetical protein C8F01DRAFT_1262145 [Mycena amicta]
MSLERSIITRHGLNPFLNRRRVLRRARPSEAGESCPVNKTTTQIIIASSSICNAFLDRLTQSVIPVVRRFPQQSRTRTVLANDIRRILSGQGAVLHERGSLATLCQLRSTYQLTQDTHLHRLVKHLLRGCFLTNDFASFTRVGLADAVEGQADRAKEDGTSGKMCRIGTEYHDSLSTLSTINKWVNKAFDSMSDNLKSFSLDTFIGDDSPDPNVHNALAVFKTLLDRITDLRQ